MRSFKLFLCFFVIALTQIDLGFCQLEEEEDIETVDSEETVIKKNEGDHEKNYDFRSPAIWYLKYPLCNAGAQQSPINIDKNLVKKAYGAMKLQASNWKVKPDEIKIMNREESVGFFPIYYNEEKVPIISGGCLGVKSFPLLYMRVRWRSGHMVSFKQYDAEIQLGFNGPMMMTFFVQTNITRPDLTRSLFEKAKKIQKKDAEYTMSKSQSPPSPFDLFGSLDSLAYFCYDGSMDFPPCEEGITWIVAEKPIHLSTSELKVFTGTTLGIKNKLTGAVSSNNRLPQPIKSRSVYYYQN